MSMPQASGPNGPSPQRPRTPSNQNGGGFDGPEWSIRVSLANLREQDYTTIGQKVRSIFDSYAERWRKSLPTFQDER